jgi:protein-disulfide isomerase
VLEQYPDKVKLVVKNFPLSRHRFARKAAQAAMAANNQGKFWAFRRALLENHQDLNSEKILEIAKSLKLDVDRFVQDMNSASVQDVITKDIVNGRQIGVRGTPTLFVNGKRAKIRTPFDLFTLIDAELRK